MAIDRPRGTWGRSIAKICVIFPGQSAPSQLRQTSQMSEYQYFEFLALDKLLPRELQQHLSRLSSRSHVSASRYAVHYDYGNFPGDPDTLIGDHFDAHLHVAAWGSRHVLLKVPARDLPLSVAAQYATEQVVEVWSDADSTVIAIRLDADDGYLEFDRPLYFEDDDDTSSPLADIASARGSLRRGDLRLLYLAWLVALVRGDVDDDDVEPPVPPGLDHLDEPLKAFVAFFELPETMIAAAAEGSAAASSPDVDDPLEEWWTLDAVEPYVAALPHAQLVDIVTSMVLGDGNAADALTQQIRHNVRDDLGLDPEDDVTTPTERRSAGAVLFREAQLLAKPDHTAPPNTSQPDTVRPEVDLDALIAEATADCYSPDEAAMGFQNFIDDELELPFTVQVLGETVTVVEVDISGEDTLVARCERGRHRQVIDLRDLPTPDPAPPGWQWVQAYRRWAG